MEMCVYAKQFKDNGVGDMNKPCQCGGEMEHAEVPEGKFKGMDVWYNLWVCWSCKQIKGNVISKR